MAWQDVFPVSPPRIAADEDQELRLAMQARAGAEWALTALVARYQPPVTRYLTRLTGNANHARTLAELVFMRMERRLHGPEGGRHLRLWLLRASTEVGLDALRKPRDGKASPRLDGPRPFALLTGSGGGATMQRLKARLGALAQATEQTRRQVRKLVWSSTPDAVVAPDFDAAESSGARHATPHPMLDEDASDGLDPLEALRYRMVRVVLSELPYGDAQCVALHLVAGLNQAEVAAALGLTNSATRRRIVQGLQLFAQRFNAAAASLGLSPDALLEGEASSQEPAVAGYVAAQEQPAAVAMPYHAAVEAVGEAAVALPDEESPRDEEPGAQVVEADAVVAAIPAVVEALPAQVEPDLESDEIPAEVAAPEMANEFPVAVDALAEASPEDADENAEPATADMGTNTGEEITLPAAHVAAVVEQVVEEHEGALDGVTLAAQDAVGEAPDSAASSIRQIPVMTLGDPASRAEERTPQDEAVATTEARVVPVLTPQPRQRVDTLPRRRGPRTGAVLVRGAGSGE